MEVKIKTKKETRRPHSVLTFQCAQQRGLRNEKKKKKKTRKQQFIGTRRK